MSALTAMGSAGSASVAMETEREFQVRGKATSQGKQETGCESDALDTVLG